MGTTEGRRLRRATEDDGAACAAIYAPYVTDTAISFETEPPSPAEMAVRIEAASRRHAWIVLQDAESVIGYAYGLPFRPRAAYSRTCEVSVYMETGRLSEAEKSLKAAEKTGFRVSPALKDEIAKRKKTGA